MFKEYSNIKGVRSEVLDGNVRGGKGVVGLVKE
jgi:hypothetical protein